MADSPNRLRTRLHGTLCAKGNTRRRHLKRTNVDRQLMSALYHTVVARSSSRGGALRAQGKAKEKHNFKKDDSFKDVTLVGGNLERKEAGGESAEEKI